MILARDVVPRGGGRYDRVTVLLPSSMLLLSHESNYINSILLENERFNKQTAWPRHERYLQKHTTLNTIRRTDHNSNS